MLSVILVIVGSVCFVVSIVLLTMMFLNQQHELDVLTKAVAALVLEAEVAKVTRKIKANTDARMSNSTDFD